jgi:hypothetical protein
MTFDVFWQIYPRRVGKLDAQKAYDKALKRTDDVTIRAAVLRYADECKGKEENFIAHPATWLNQGRWMDEKKSARALGYWFGPTKQFPAETRARPRYISRANWAQLFVPETDPRYPQMVERTSWWQTDPREYAFEKGGIRVVQTWWR